MFQLGMYRKEGEGRLWETNVRNPDFKGIQSS